MRWDPRWLVRGATVCMKGGSTPQGSGRDDDDDARAECRGEHDAGAADQQIPAAPAQGRPRDHGRRRAAVRGQRVSAMPASSSMRSVAAAAIASPTNGSFVVAGWSATKNRVAPACLAKRPTPAS